MRRRICTLGQTEIFVHAATALFALYVMLSGARWTALAGFASILLHEGAHALTATLLGQAPREIEITPMGAVMRLEDEERLPPLRRMLMLAAGPGMSALLAALAIRLTAQGWLAPPLGRTLFLSNAAILMVNLLPALPLDGGRLLALLLGCFLRGETVRRIMRTGGTLIGAATVAGSLYLAWRYGAWNWSLAAAGCFLMYAAATATTNLALHELQGLMARRLLLEKRGYAPLRRIAVLPGMPLHRAVRLLSPRVMTEFCLMEQGTMRSLGTLREDQLISAWLDAPEKTVLHASKAVGTGVDQHD